ncbi:cyclin-dependent kinase inhibitor 3 family protein [Vibrio aphrogenes]|uniref:cyclin-dependent kinase inhibitor 3 family protein n=1 Tax=Vibrio aphrogenes TaxID=1891186 RepID=UPI000B355694|nr:cyclin-dependent kinase inhibitor 3 family protein [Vibrio aphrogenes]
MTHPTWELPVEENNAGLVLTPCPGTKDASLSDSVEQLKSQGVTVVVTALSMKEMQDKGVGDLPDIVEKAGLQWFHTPIEDDCAPDEAFQARWKHVSPSLHKALTNGDKIAMHCMGGSGRTGLLAAHLLLEKGWSLPEIISQVQALRPGAFTKDVQVEYIHQFVNQ